MWDENDGLILSVNESSLRYAYARAQVINEINCYGARMPNNGKLVYEFIQTVCLCPACTTVNVASAEFHGA